jgi:hypothetical protein
MIAHILSASALTLFVEGQAYSLASNHRHFDRALAALRAGDTAGLLALVNPTQCVINGTTAHPEFHVADGVVTYQGQQLQGYAIDKLLELCTEGFPVEPLINFIVRVQGNPSNRAVTDLYQFLERGDLPLLPDGRFIAYKNVGDNYLDLHTGTLSNRVGTVVEMPRNQVDDNPTRTCSHGLHVCSQAYLQHFGGRHCMAVAVDPADVVSIPVDYGHSKMRVCRYEVLAELAEPPARKNYWDIPVVYDYSDDDNDDDELENGLEESEDELEETETLSA